MSARAHVVCVYVYQFQWKVLAAVATVELTLETGIREQIILWSSALTSYWLSRSLFLSLLTGELEKRLFVQVTRHPQQSCLETVWKCGLEGKAARAAAAVSTALCWCHWPRSSLYYPWCWPHFNWTTHFTHWRLTGDIFRPEETLWTFLQQVAEASSQTDQRSEWWKDSPALFLPLPSSTFVWQKEVVGLSSVCVGVGTLLHLSYARYRNATQHTDAETDCVVVPTVCTACVGSYCSICWFWLSLLMQHISCS